MAKKYDFSEEAIRKNRKFPVLSTVLLVLIVILQFVMLVSAVFYQPEPQDVIKSYKVYVTQRDDGSLDIEYEFVWTPLDKNEPLSWVEIGMANGNFAFSADYSENVRRLENDSGDGYSYAVVYFRREYLGGNTFSFNFKVNQRGMFCKDGDVEFYDFIPGWFNSIQVQKYEFYWKKDATIADTNADRETADWYVWEGSLDYGEYRRLRVICNGVEAYAAPYEEISIDAYNELKSDKLGFAIMMIMFVLILVIFEVIIVDSYVSYTRGRGFLRGYGHHVHVYGRRNPHYVAAYHAHSSTSSGGGRSGGGCACACACACAGGGRAGCSQKDTYKAKKDKE